MARRAPPRAAQLDVSPRVVRASGGIITRPADGDDVRVLLVHRPRYDDWSFPKGKVDGAETDEEAARREVQEETGLVCRLLDSIGEVTYRDRDRNAKVVRYWHMEPEVDHGFAPNREVDELRWCTPADAATLLTYEHDRGLLARFSARG